MRVLVTGATGYLGRAVVAELLAAGHEVSALVRRRPVVGADVEPHHGDVLDEGAAAAAVRGVDAVVHLAGLSAVRESVQQPGRFYRINVGGTATVLEALAAAAAAGEARPRFVLASTGAVYGTPRRQPIREDAHPDPKSPYAATKLAAEELLGWAVSDRRFAAASLRIFNAAGAIDRHGEPDDTRIFTRVLAAAAGNIPHVEVHGDGSAVRDYVHIKDIARAFRTVLDTLTLGRHEVYNVGATPASVADIIDVARQVTGRSIRVVHRPANASEPPELRANTAKLRSLGWQPQHSALDQLIRDQWRAFG
jgi:UDP-glucose 4-epimerase